MEYYEFLDIGRWVNVTYLDFSKILDTLSHTLGQGNHAEGPRQVARMKGQFYGI